MDDVARRSEVHPLLIKLYTDLYETVLESRRNAILLSDLRTPATMANVYKDDSLPAAALSKSKTLHSAAVALVASSTTLVMRSLVALSIVEPTLSENSVASNTCVLDEKSAMITAATEMSCVDLVTLLRSDPKTTK